MLGIMGASVAIRPKVRSDLFADDILLTGLSPGMSYRYYSLEVVQHPIRARMCGFGDKVCYMNPFHARYAHPAAALLQDRRPLAPAAVAKMVVHREDHSIVDVE